jgi:hypothetical protein
MEFFFFLMQSHSRQPLPLQNVISMDAKVKNATLLRMAGRKGKTDPMLN